MSTCISQHGEYSSHTFDDGKPGDIGADEFTCTRCGVFDEDAALTALRESRLSRARISQRLADLTRGINDQLGPEILRQKAEAWDEGRVADVDWHISGDPIPVNPYRKEQGR